jgi:hypothetical protein
MYYAREELVMKLGDWPRLWILVSVLYLCVVVGGTFIFYPKDGSVSEWVVFKEMSPDTGKKLKKYYLNGLVLNDRFKTDADSARIAVIFEDSNHKLFFPKNTTKEELRALSDEFRDAIPKAQKNKKRSFLLSISLIWAISCILFYVLGWSIGYAYRGFHRSK